MKLDQCKCGANSWQLLKTEKKCDNCGNNVHLKGPAAFSAAEGCVKNSLPHGRGNHNENSLPKRREG